MENNYNEKWQNTLQSIKQVVTEISFNTWFTPLLLKKVDEVDNIIIFETFNPLVIKVINERYITMLHEKILENFNIPLKARFVIPTETKSKNKSNEYTEEVIFNPRYTFDNFVVGEHNQYAHAAAVAVAESPSAVYNPLYIYGDSGLGKTHLMHAIGCHIMKNRPELSILYVSAEMFTNELIEAIRDHKMDDFKEKYRNKDVLLIDDVQFIEGKERSEEEFYHTFNALHDKNRQIVLSSDRPPTKLTKLDERLKSRFEWNLVADIMAPDFETRAAILRTKANLEGVELDEDVIEVINFISEKIKYNVRELEGAFLRVISFSALMDEKITIKFAKKILKEIVQASDTTITPERIKKSVCKKFNIKTTDMESKKRARNVAYPRQIAMYLCREILEMSYPKIGESFGGRDHTTVMHACDKIQYEIGTNDDLKKIVNDINADLKDSY